MGRLLLVASLGMVLVLGLAGSSHAQSRSRAKSEDSKSESKQKTDTSQDSAKETETAKESDATSKKDSDTKNSGSTDTKSKKLPKIARATFGGGCFWCMEAVFERIPGVKSVTSGFAGGHVPNPTYEMVSTGLTGHAEVIQIEYDPSIVTYDKLLKIFWLAHDPTTLNSQGDDFGPQYRSIILYQDEDQRKIAANQIRELQAHRARRSPIVTQLVPLEEFYPAEAYHQDYFRNHPDNDYSQFYIIPKLQKLRSKLK